MRLKDYIESPQHWKDMYSNAAVNGEWKPLDKIQIKRIKVNKSLFSFPNEVDLMQVEEMVKNFNQELWIPILVNEDFFLLDGQHRLAAAKRMKIRYVDVIVQDSALLKKSRLPATNRRSRYCRRYIATREVSL